jgi:HlyD family secretion protein
MISSTHRTGRHRRAFAGVLLALVTLSACEKKESGLLQGYVEGEFVYVAAPSGGTVAKLAVQRGDQVKAGDLLYSLEGDPEQSARDEESLSAQLEQSKAAAGLSARELARQEQLARSGATSKDDVDRARSTHEQNQHRVAQLEADLKTAQLGLRSDQITAAEAEVHAREAALSRAEWELAQKTQKSPKAGLISDTLCS